MDGGRVPCILNMCSRWRWVSRFKSFGFTRERKAHWTASWVGSKCGLELFFFFGDSKLSLSVPRNEPRLGLTTDIVLKRSPKFWSRVSVALAVSEKLAPRLFATAVRNACPDLFVGLQTTYSFSLRPYMRQDRCWLAVFDLWGCFYDKLTQYNSLACRLESLTDWKLV